MRSRARVNSHRVVEVVNSGGEAFADVFSLKIIAADSNATGTDAGTFVINLAQSDSNAGQTETAQLKFPSGDFGDSNTAPSETRSFTMRIWLSGGSGGTNPANADGANNGTVATLQTAVAGASTITLTSALGANVPSGLTISAAIYRGWFKSVNTLVSSTGSLVMHSTTAAFSDITMFSNSALNTTVDRLDGSFTYDLVAAGVDTLAKLQSCQMLHRVTDAVAGVTPHVLTVDAGCIELAGAFT